MNRDLLARRAEQQSVYIQVWTKTDNLGNVSLRSLNETNGSARVRTRAGAAGARDRNVLLGAPIIIARCVPRICSVFWERANWDKRRSTGKARCFFSSISVAVSVLPYSLWCRSNARNLFRRLGRRPPSYSYLCSRWFHVVVSSSLKNGQILITSPASF